MTAIAVPIFVKQGVDLEEVIGEAEEALEGLPEGGAILELRVDTASVKMVEEAIDLARLPVLVTVRAKWEGGFSDKKDEERIAIWEAAMEAGAEYIDVELVAWEKSKRLREEIGETVEKTGTRLVISNHCFDGRPKDLAERMERLRAVKEASVLKLAWKAQGILDGLEALKMVREIGKVDKRGVVALAMGEEGQLSRVLAKKFGAAFTFATVGGKESAPGQPTVAELREVYRWEAQKAASKVFGVIGWPVAQSKSPHVHNAGFSEIGFDGVYVRMPIREEDQAFEKTLEAMRGDSTLNLRGVSVTIPHKENAMRYARTHGATIDEVSAGIGVLNTLVWEKTGKIRGTNTDYAGAIDALVSVWGGKREAVHGKRVAVLGAGGAARAVIAGLAAYGATVVIYNRTQEKAEKLAKDFSKLAKEKAGKVLTGQWEKIGESSCEAYINCTPLGMHPNVSTSPLEDGDVGKINWTRNSVIFDTVYNPRRTKLLKQAAKAGAATIEGTEMFVRQAAAQFELFTGKIVSIDIFRTAMDLA